MGLKGVFVGGKGGVGKTTVSCLLAERLSLSRKVLLVSTDYAHSLRDFYRRSRSMEMEQVARNLVVHELDPEAALKEQVSRVEDELSRNVSSIVAEQLKEFLDFASSDPGSYDYAAFQKLVEMALSLKEEILIVDMAPTAQALKFFRLPARLERWYGLLLRWRKRYLKVKEMVSEEAQDRMLPFLEGKREQMRAFQQLLSSSLLLWVVEPEEFSVKESQRALKLLAEEVGRVVIVVNRVAGEDHPLRRVQSRMLAEIERLFPFPRIYLPLVQPPVAFNEPSARQLLERLEPLSALFS